MFKLVLLFLAIIVPSVVSTQDLSNTKRIELLNRYNELKDAVDYGNKFEAAGDLNDFLNIDFYEHQDIKAKTLLLKSLVFLEINQMDSCNYYLDVSLKQIERYGLDSLLGEYYLMHGYSYLPTFQYEASKNWHKKALAEFENRRDTTRIMLALRALVSEYATLSLLDSAEIFLDPFMNLSEMTKDSVLLVSAILSKAHLEYLKENYPHAAGYAIKGYELANKLNIQREQMSAAVSLYNLYHNLGNYPRAIDYLDKAIEASRTAGNLRFINLFKLGKVGLLINDDQILTAENILAALERDHIVELEGNLKIYYCAIKGMLHFHKTENEESELWLDQLVPHIEEFENQGGFLMLQDGGLSLAQLKFQKGNTSEAIQISYKLLRGKKLGIEQKKEILKLLSACYAKQKNEKKALEYLQRMEAIRDNIEVAYGESQILAQEQEYITDKQNMKITQLELESELNNELALKRRNLLFYTLMSSLFLIGFSFLWGRHRKLQLDKALIETQQQLLKLQVNPHFMYNALNSIQNAVLTQNTGKSVNLISMFSKLTRQVLNNSKRTMIPISEELELLTNYLELEKARTQDKFDYNIEIDSNVDVNNQEIPSMMLQLFVENSIWHGLIPKEEKGMISIKFQKRDERIEVVVEDNGIGRKESALQKSNDQKNNVSMGINIIQERIKILNKKYKKNITLETKDGANGIGTRVLLSA